MAQLAGEELAYVENYTWDDNLAPDISAKVLALEGYVNSANALLKQGKVKPEDTTIQRASLCRNSGRYWRSLLVFIRAAIQNRCKLNAKNIALLGCLESFLNAAESSQRWFLFRSWGMRGLYRTMANIFANGIDIARYEARDVVASAKAEMVWLRYWVLLDNDIEALFEHGTLWKLIAEHGIPQGAVVK